MKVSLIIAISLFMMGCATQPYKSPDGKNEFDTARSNIDNCLIEQLLKSAKANIEPEMAISVSATRCEHTALVEAEKLRKMHGGLGFQEFMIGIPNSNRAYTEGFVSKLADRDELKAQAESLLVRMLQKEN